MPNQEPNKRAEFPFPLDNPPEFHYKLLDYGERPYWSPDGKRIAFVESNYGDVCEIDMETRQVRNLTKNNGDHHSFLRVLFLPNGDYLLIGPAVFKDRRTSRRVESELWFMDREAKNPPYPLGQRIFEGIGVSRFQNKITYAVNSEEYPELFAPGEFEVRVQDVLYGPNGAYLGEPKVIYRAQKGFEPEPQDFRLHDTQIVMAEYCNHNMGLPVEEEYCVVKTVDIETGEVRLMIREKGIHNECEGIFPDEQYTCLESSRDLGPSGTTTDLWKMALDGTGRRVRMTRMIDYYPWRTSNSNVSPDGKWLAFMMNIHGSEAGYGMGMGLLDLEAWEKSPYAQMWETPVFFDPDKKSE